MFRGNMEPNIEERKATDTKMQGTKQKEPTKNGEIFYKGCGIDQN